MGEIKWPQDMVEINILPTQEVEVKYKYWNEYFQPIDPDVKKIKALNRALVK